MKKCQSHQDKIQFFGYIVSTHGIWIEDKKIKLVKTLPELQLIWDIQVFLGFINLYRQFIRGFSKIAILLTSILIITLSISAQLGYTKVDENEFNIDNDSRNSRISSSKNNNKVAN